MTDCFIFGTIQKRQTQPPWVGLGGGILQGLGEPMTVLLCHKGTALAAHCLWRAEKKARLAIAHGDWIIAQDALDTIRQIRHRAADGSALARSAEAANDSLAKAIFRHARGVPLSAFRLADDVEDDSERDYADMTVVADRDETERAIVEAEAAIRGFRKVVPGFVSHAFPDDPASR